MTTQLPPGNWRLDPFRRIQVWVPKEPMLPVVDAFDEPADPLEHKNPIKHGTATGYRQHRYRGIPSCEACRQAETRAKWDRINRKAEAA